MLTPALTLLLNSTQYSKHSTKYGHLFYVSRKNHTRRCCCIVFTTSRCHCLSPTVPLRRPCTSGWVRSAATQARERTYAVTHCSDEWLSTNPNRASARQSTRSVFSSSPDHLPRPLCTGPADRPAAGPLRVFRGPGPALATDVNPRHP